MGFIPLLGRAVYPTDGSPLLDDCNRQGPSRPVDPGGVQLIPLLDAAAAAYPCDRDIRAVRHTRWQTQVFAGN